MEVEVFVDRLQGDGAIVRPRHKPVRTLKPYWRPRLSEPLRRRLGCISGKYVTTAAGPLMIKGEPISYHNLYHFEVSCLERIPIGEEMVSGIHGFHAPMFHNLYLEAEYDGVLDEARVAVHEWLTRPSFYNTLKLINWIVWLLRQGINPAIVILRHLSSLQQFTCTFRRSIVHSSVDLYRRQFKHSGIGS